MRRILENVKLGHYYFSFLGGAVINSCALSHWSYSILFIIKDKVLRSPVEPALHGCPSPVVREGQVFLPKV